MTTLSAFHSLTSLSSIYKPAAAVHPHLHFHRRGLRNTLSALHSGTAGGDCWSRRRMQTHKSTIQRTMIKSVTEETQIAESSGSEQEASSDQSFSVPVSPSDKLVMCFLVDSATCSSVTATYLQWIVCSLPTLVLFTVLWIFLPLIFSALQAEGTIDEKSIPSVTKALEGQEGISDLKLGVSEGIASIQLTKETTIQATGVASGLVELIQGSGFKLQTLNLSFDDDE